MACRHLGRLRLSSLLAVSTACGPAPAPRPAPPAVPVVDTRASSSSPAPAALPAATAWRVELTMEEQPPPPSDCAADDQDCAIEWEMNHLAQVYRVEVTPPGEPRRTLDWTINDDAMFEGRWTLRVVHEASDFVVAEVLTPPVRSECLVQRAFALRIDADEVQTLWDEEAHWTVVVVTAEAGRAVMAGTQCETNALSDHYGQARGCRITLGFDGAVDEQCEPWAAPAAVEGGGLLDAGSR